MPVRIVFADRHERDGSAGRAQEPVGVCGTSVVGHVQHVDHDALGARQQPALCRLLGVAGQQDRTVRAVDAKHHRVLVEVACGQATLRR